MMRRSLSACAVMMTLCAATAQAGDTPDAAELQAQLERRMQRAAEMAERAVQSGGAGVPAIDLGNLPMPALEHTPVDVEALARQYDEAWAPPPVETPTLLAFVSLSMPRESLLRLVADAERSGATVVMRGLIESSIQKTMQAVAEIIGTRQVAWVIDPETFTRFEIQTVPSYVLLRAGVTPAACGAETCFAPGDYVRLAGDVAIDYALERIEVRAPEFGDAARHFRRTTQ